MRDYLLGAAVLAAWLWSTQPADAVEPVPSDAAWPEINQMPMVPVLVGHNVFGDKVVLFAQFCGGNADNSKRDHMHVYSIYDSHGSFVQGGCWQFDPVYTRTKRTIKHFDMNGAGWNSWPLDAFRPARATN